MNNQRKLHCTYKNNWEIIQWIIPVIFSAPHAAPQTREWARKPCDEFTWEIVRQLCQKTWAYGIIRIENFDDDPNYYNEWLSLDFKNEIIDLIKKNWIKYWFDIHGCKDDLWFSIDIWTNYWENINQNLDFLINVQKNLSNNFWRVAVDEIFDAWKSEIVSTYVSKKVSCPYIQLEVCRALRDENEYLVSLLSDMVLETMILP
jgi:hypothetical protein